jgi:hypothetical protein
MKPRIYSELQSTFAWFCDPDPAPVKSPHSHVEAGPARTACAIEQRCCQAILPQTLDICQASHVFAVCLVQFFRQHGWRQPEVTSYSHMAAGTGKPTEIFSSECTSGGWHDKMCPFIVAHTG